MIIKLYDMNHLECEEDDVIILHFTSENVKYVGLLKFRKESLQFVLSDGDEDWYSLGNASAKFEKVGKFSQRRELEKIFGHNELFTKKKREHFYSILNPF